MNATYAIRRIKRGHTFPDCFCFHSPRKCPVNDSVICLVLPRPQDGSDRAYVFYVYCVAPVSAEH